MIVIKNCKRCNEEFMAPVGRRRLYCSLKCAQKARRTITETKCLECKRPFLAWPSDIAKGAGKYCSRACKARGGMKRCPNCKHILSKKKISGRLSVFEKILKGEL